MSTERYDVVVLGSGAGGKLLSWHLASAGHHTAVVERKWIGGSCFYNNSVTTKNEIAGIHCAQTRTLEARIELAHQLRRRYRLFTSILIDALDDRAWRAFGGAPNVAILVDPDGRIAVKQGWFEPQEMARAITELLKNSPVTPADRMSHHG